jgi:hypothetical protein
VVSTKTKRIRGRLFKVRPINDDTVIFEVKEEDSHYRITEFEARSSLYDSLQSLVGKEVEVKLIQSAETNKYVVDSVQLKQQKGQEKDDRSSANLLDTFG